jgi:hypothetical protein
MFCLGVEGTLTSHPASDIDFVSYNQRSEKPNLGLVFIKSHHVSTISFDVQRNPLQMVLRTNLSFETHFTHYFWSSPRFIPSLSYFAGKICNPIFQFGNFIFFKKYIYLGNSFGVFIQDARDL